jgi:alanine racemase
MTLSSKPLARFSIDLDAVARNYLFLKKKLQAGADCAAVVKADAYGLGAVEISKELFSQGCRHFFVAQFEEGLALKEALPVSGVPGNDFSIYVLDGPQGADPRDFEAAGLIPVLNSPADVTAWTAAGKKRPAVLHIDTGMNRLGFSAKEIADLASRPEALKPFDIRYVMSHLACGDTPGHPMNAAQLETFRRLAASFEKPFRMSFANSGGVLLGEAYHFDLARPGCALYGINPQSGIENPMQGVVTFEGAVLQVRDIDSAGSVGYGASYPVSLGQKYATISVGYADGYLRSLGGRGTVVIAGVKCPVVGRVSMDSIVADISHLKAEVRIGDTAEIIGAQQLVDEVAAQAGTIGYEILTGLGKRVKRIYRRQGA